MNGCDMALLIYLFIALCMPSFGQMSVSRICADEECKEPFSQARVLVSYRADNQKKIDVNKGDLVTVFSKEGPLWKVEIHGKRGYVPYNILQETNVFKKFKKSTENKSAGEQNNDEKSTVLNKKVPNTEFIQESLSVVDGTTLYPDISDSALETQPIETAYAGSIVQETLSLHYTKTIDATSISKNKLDEPNDSLILPQPTTSSDANYRENSQTATRELSGPLNSSTLQLLQESEINKEVLSSDITSAQVDLNEETPQNGDETLGSEEEEEGEEEEEEEEEDDELGDEDDGEDDEVSEEGESVVDDLAVGVGKKEDHPIASEADLSKEVVEETPTDSQLLDVSTMQLDNNFSDVSSEVVKDAIVENVQTEVPLHASSLEEVKQDENNIASTEKALLQSERFNATIEEPSFNTSDNDSKTTSEHTEIDESHSQMHEKGETYEHEVVQDQTSQEFVPDTTTASTVPSNKIYRMFNSEESDKVVQTAYVSPEEEMLVKDGNLDDSKGTEESNLLSEENDTVTAPGEDVTEAMPTADTVVTPPVDAVTEEQQIDDSVVRTTAESTESFVGEVKPETSDEQIDSSTGEYKQVDEGNEVEEQSEEKSSEGIFSSLAHFISSGYRNVYQVTFSSRGPQLEPIETVNENSIVDPVDRTDSEVISGTCEAAACESEMGSLPREPLQAAQTKWPTIQDLDKADSTMDMNKTSFDTFMYLIITAITVLIFSLGHYYIEKKRRDGSLIAKINTLEKALMVSSQEKFELRDELEKLTLNRKLSDDGDSNPLLLQELEECKAARSELEEQVASLEVQLFDATEAGLELNRMMSELLSAQHGSDTLMKSVEHLQKQLDSQQGTISTMNACLTAKNLENENLQSEISLASEKIHSLEDQLDKMKSSLTDLSKEKNEMEQSLVVKNQAIEQKLVEALESKSADSQRLCRELDALQDVLDETRKTLAAREGEVTVLRDCLSHTEGLSEGGKLSISVEALLDVGQLRANVELITKDRDELKERLQGEEDARKLLEDHMKIVSEEVSTLRAKYEEAERCKVEAQTRLEVLSNYFKEKETQLQKELGLQEAMCIQKEGDVLSTIERIKLSQEEIDSYKTQNELLKKEILDQERSLKSQIVMLEKKVHENWVSARQAERKLEESKQEASQLRNKLTLSGRRVAGTMPEVGKPERDLEHNGEVSSSPVGVGDTQEMHYGLPASPPLLPPGPFPGMPPPFMVPPGMPPFPLPPPLPGLFCDDLRPPPLGRMSSPPPEPPFNHSPPLSPPNRPYRSPIHHYDEPSGRYRHRSPPVSGPPPFHCPYPPAGKWDERGPPRAGFRPVHRDSPREPKGSGLGSDHSSDSLEKGGHHGSRV